MLCALILYECGGAYSLTSAPNDRFLRNLFMAGLFALRVFAGNLLRGNRQKNKFHISFLMTDLGYEFRLLRLIRPRRLQWPVITPITVLSLLLCSISSVIVSLIQIFCLVKFFSEPTRPLLMRSTFAFSILSPQVLEVILKVKNLSESSMAVPLLAISFALQMLVSRFAISLKHLRQSFTILKFITLESNALMVPWLLESMVTLRLWMYLSIIIFTAAWIAMLHT